MTKTRNVESLERNGYEYGKRDTLLIKAICKMWKRQLDKA